MCSHAHFWQAMHCSLTQHLAMMTAGSQLFDGPVPSLPECSAMRSDYCHGGSWSSAPARGAWQDCQTGSPPPIAQTGEARIVELEAQLAAKTNALAKAEADFDGQLQLLDARLSEEQLALKTQSSTLLEDLKGDLTAGSQAIKQVGELEQRIAELESQLPSAAHGAAPASEVDLFDWFYDTDHTQSHAPQPPPQKALWCR